MLILIGFAVFVVGLLFLVLWSGTQVSGSLAEEEEAGDNK